MTMPAVLCKHEVGVSLPVDDPDAVLAQGHAASAVGVASVDDGVPRAAGASATTTSMPGKGTRPPERRRRRRLRLAHP
jgi:hypothetical protein